MFFPVQHFRLVFFKAKAFFIQENSVNKQIFMMIEKGGDDAGNGGFFPCSEKLHPAPLCEAGYA